jgi:Domain of unknown function (DUF4232)
MATALLVTAVLLQAGCSAASSDPPLRASLSPVAAGPSPAASRSAQRVEPAPSPSPERLRLIPLECRYADLRIGAGPWTDAATGERSMVFAVRNVGSTPCALFGYPRLRLLAKDGDLLPFKFMHGSPYTRGGQPVVQIVRSGLAAYFKVGKYRCDLGNVEMAVTARIRLAYVGGSFVVPARDRRGGRPFGWCGDDLAGPEVGVSPIRPDVASTGYGNYNTGVVGAVDMRGRLSPFLASFGPGHQAASYGRGDVNGDGRPDLLVVRTSGLVTAGVSGVGRRTVRLRPDSTLRLQAITDLTGSGRDDVLVSATAAGCCGGYENTSSTSQVIRFRHDRLATVRLPSGHALDLTFGEGRGDLFAGVRCHTGALDQVSLLLTGPTSGTLDVVRHTFDQFKATSHPVEHRTLHGTLDALAAAAVTRCDGMTTSGWAL